MYACNAHYKCDLTFLLTHLLWTLTSEYFCSGPEVKQGRGEEGRKEERRGGRIGDEGREEERRGRGIGEEGREEERRGRRIGEEGRED